VFQPSDHFHSPPLDPLQQVHPCLFCASRWTSPSSSRNARNPTHLAENEPVQKAVARLPTADVASSFPCGGRARRGGPAAAGLAMASGYKSLPTPAPPAQNALHQISAAAPYLVGCSPPPSCLSTLAAPSCSGTVGSLGGSAGVCDAAGSGSVAGPAS